MVQTPPTRILEENKENYRVNDKLADLIICIINTNNNPNLISKILSHTKRNKINLLSEIKL